ncbi:hypothetical protein O3614_10430, partial [Streptococcus parasanguinis]|uniref:hypothetical protein n=1 Tax=Streptococcus parasanguinis TaxID=1318 RepID=UPI00352C7963
NTARAATDDNKTFFIVLSPFFFSKINRYFVTMTSILGYSSYVKTFFLIFLKKFKFSIYLNAKHTRFESHSEYTSYSITIVINPSLH